jgi:WD40 repeat protein
VARVFVSHAGEDLALAGEVHLWLVEDGHEVFLDQHLRDGLVVGRQLPGPGASPGRPADRPQRRGVIGGVRPGRVHLATASADKTVQLWDVSDPGQPRRLGDPLTGHTNGVTAVAFAPDGTPRPPPATTRRCCCGTSAALTRFAQTLWRACSITGRGLNADEWSRSHPRSGVRGLLLKVRQTDRHTCAPPLPGSGFR